MHESASRNEDATGTSAGLPEFGLRETSLGRRRTQWSYFCLSAAVQTDSGPDIRMTLICVGFEVRTAVTMQNSRLGYCAMKCDKKFADVSDGTYFLHVWNPRVHATSKKLAVPAAWLLDFLFDLEDGGNTFLRNVEKLYQTARRHIPEDSNRHLPSSSRKNKAHWEVVAHGRSHVSSQICYLKDLDLIWNWSYTLRVVSVCIPSV
jgi:hypothetical protein